jgi:hypothetical protein
MLVSFRSSNLSWALMAALVAACREVRAARRIPRFAINRGLGATKRDPGGVLLEIGGIPAGLASPIGFEAGGGS